MMKQMNGNISDQDERGLLPYPVIIAATKGDKGRSRSNENCRTAL